MKTDEAESRLNELSKRDNCMTKAIIDIAQQTLQISVSRIYYLQSHTYNVCSKCYMHPTNVISLQTFLTLNSYLIPTMSLCINVL